jgi:hypothetical protein
MITCAWDLEEECCFYKELLTTLIGRLGGAVALPAAEIDDSTQQFWLRVHIDPKTQAVVLTTQEVGLRLVRLPQGRGRKHRRRRRKQPRRR